MRAKQKTKGKKPLKVGTYMQQKKKTSGNLKVEMEDEQFTPPSTAPAAPSPAAEAVVQTTPYPDT